MIPFPEEARTPDEQASGAIRLAMGGQVRLLPVLPIVHNREWTATFAEAVKAVLSDLGSRLSTLDQVVWELASNVDQMVDMLVAYDRTGVLGGKEWIEQHAAPRDVYHAFRQVTVAAFPTVEDLMRHAPELRLTLMQALVQTATSSTSTKPSQPNTGGRRRASKRS